jgi:polyphosphate kinase 2
LLKLQLHAKETGIKLLVICEGRDAAGKGGAIKRFMEHLNPRGARVVALEKPTEVEQTQWYFQRYIQHLPSGGEIVFMDRSWYNRAGVERVMGYCTPQQYLEFMRETPDLERMLVNSGIHLVKLWFSVSREEQLARFSSRQNDPVRQWKLSPTDLASLDKWDAYTEAKEAMFFYTDTGDSPWTVIKSNDKKRARLEAFRVILSTGQATAVRAGAARNAPRRAATTPTASEERAGAARTTAAPRCSPSASSASLVADRTADGEEGQQAADPGGPAVPSAAGADAPGAAAPGSRT